MSATATQARTDAATRLRGAIIEYLETIKRGERCTVRADGKAVEALEFDGVAVVRRLRETRSELLDAVHAADLAGVCASARHTIEYSPASVLFANRRVYEPMTVTFLDDEQESGECIERVDARVIDVLDRALGDPDFPEARPEADDHSAEWSEPMTRAEMARRLSGNPDARSETYEALLSRLQCTHVSGKRFKVRLDLADQDTRKRLLAPLTNGAPR